MSKEALLLVPIALAMHGAGAVGRGVASLFGQVTALDPGLSSLIGNMGIMGVLVWHLWYHTTHSYPKMMDKFSSEAEKLRGAFQTELQSLRETFRQEQTDQRAYSTRESAELRSMLIQTLQSMRTAVHDVKDTAQTAINRATLAAVTNDKGKSQG